MININFNIGTTLLLITIGAIGGGSIVVYVFKHPELIDKWIAFITKYLKFLSKKIEYSYVKHDIQSVVNGYIAKLSEKVPNLLVKRVSLDWIDESITAEQFTKNEMLVMRMHKSNNQALNVVNATFTFVSYSLLVKAKNYIAKYQKNAIDLYVSYKILENEKIQLLQTYVQEILKDGLNDKNTNDFYGKFFDIDKAGLFFPVFVTEMTFLGEKVFGNKKNDKEIFEEVRRLVVFLYQYANRKLHESAISEFDGQYCNFAIRIVGISSKIQQQGKDVYIRNLKKIPNSVETIYIIGGVVNKGFINQVVDDCLETMSYDIYNNYVYTAKLKNTKGKEFNCNNFLTILRSRNVQYYHNN